MEHFLDFENLKNSFQDFLVLCDLLDGLADKIRAHRRGVREFSRSSAFGTTLNDRHLVGFLLAYRGGDMSETVDDLLLDLMNHLIISKMHLADIN